MNDESSTIITGGLERPSENNNDNDAIQIPFRQTGNVEDDLGDSNDHIGDDDFDDDDEDDDDDLILGDVPLIEHPGQIPTKKLEEPPEGLQWKDDSILECFQLAVATHDQDYHDLATQDSTATLHSFQWSAPPTNNNNDADEPQQSTKERNEHDMEFLSAWKPKSLPLPIWAVAVDPIAIAASVADTTTVDARNGDPGKQ